ncbi:carboxymuconolactone decarboxylase family protein [Streptomyces sp. NL15-2K]|uniref:carboxymuconolactone decarboxylase family protein n=1 Tax=Streptomyces sp. NL15-2K TaxID=376149 RepID=UPI000FF9B048|nr:MULTISPECIES: carboxymuconolactone decarboxylase family protein [Actinomycetes]WKX15408.1 carboxymuconolactone decarboxylase family protein [Kutzneria buriramensis]GCB52591.1 hypothetical protein SNL152K_9948 [Streptomyces sp. NL15-2K]
MTRLDPVPYAEWDQDAIFPMTGGRTVPHANSISFLLNHPELTKAFLTLSTHLAAKSTLPAKLRELAILRIAWRRRCRYEWAQHVAGARRKGATEDEIAAVRAGADTLLNRAVDELDRDSRLSDATYAALAEEEGLDDRQMMDLVFTVGGYGTLAMAFNTFEVELEDGLDDEGFDEAADASAREQCG